MSNYDKALVGVETIRPPMVPGLSRDARFLNVEALVWSRANRTDGVIPAGQLRWVTDAPDPDALAAELVGAGIWESGGEDFEIVGFLETQMSSERVAQREASARERWQRFLDGQGGKRKRAGSSAANAAANGAGSDSDLTRSEERGRSAPSASARAAASGAACEADGCRKPGKPWVTTKDDTVRGGDLIGNYCDDHALTSDDERVGQLRSGMTYTEFKAIFGGAMFVDSNNGYPAGWGECAADAGHPEDEYGSVLFPVSELTVVGKYRYCPAHAGPEE